MLNFTKNAEGKLVSDCGRFALERVSGYWNLYMDGVKVVVKGRLSKTKALELAQSFVNREEGWKKIEPVLGVIQTSLLNAEKVEIVPQSIDSSSVDFSDGETVVVGSPVDTSEYEKVVVNNPSQMSTAALESGAIEEEIAVESPQNVFEQSTINPLESLQNKESIASEFLEQLETFHVAETRKFSEQEDDEYFKSIGTSEIEIPPTPKDSRELSLLGMPVSAGEIPQEFVDKHWDELDKEVQETVVAVLDEPEQEESPLIRQYWTAKERHPDMVLLFRVGDFYESFGQDAEAVNQTVGASLTFRGHLPMTGFPHHALEVNLQKLLKSNRRVAICEPIENRLNSDYQPPRIEVPQPVAHERTPEQTQEVINTFLWKFGPNVRSWAGYENRLAQFGLTLEDVTESAWAKAVVEMHQRVENKFKGDKMGRQVPLAALAIGSWFIVPQSKHDTVVVVGQLDGLNDSEATVILHRSRGKSDERTHWSGATMVIASTEENAKAALRGVPVAESENKGSETMSKALHLTEVNARKMLVAAGKTSAGDKEKMDKKKLLVYLAKLDQYTETLTVPTEADDAELFNSVVEAAKNGVSIEFSANGKAEKPAKEKKEKAVKPAKEPKAEKPVKEKKEKVAKPKKEGVRVKIMGKYSAGSFARWLGRRGVPFDDAKKIMVANGGCPLSDVSLKWELKEVRENRPPAKVEKEDKEVLMKKYPELIKK